MSQKMIAFAVLLFVTVTSLPTDVSAQTTRQLYGHGVHAYFAGRLVDAEHLFSTAIKSGSQDPRCYYFRGVTYAKQGRQFEAEQDFRTAATLEMKSSIPVNIGMSLERVQGAHRMKLEAVRRDTKLAIARQRAVSEPNSLPANAATNRPTKGSLTYDPTDPFADLGDKTPSESTASNEPPITGDVTGAASGALRGLMEAVRKALPSGVNIADSFPGLPGGIGGGRAFPPKGGDGLLGSEDVGGGPFGADPFGGEEPAMEEDDGDPFANDAFGADPFGGEEPAMEEDDGDPFGIEEPAMEEAVTEETEDVDDPFSQGDGSSDTDPFAPDMETDEPADEDVDPFADDE